ncbi:EAL domain, c-di-GMP-specific phosphodiesterase class I (or its enzymatically inactive variant) [Granulicella rosea]|uniref:EAL domain, c-di-GMP-specific phosphodiesterase class I (Or its enzymatically inactive variant) n=1 Tax=Granulicella rosea TaxID=474952 RepID=A0A239LLV4_9BACT|nr:EAL domain-containing protein [Granulicella rosea]SNT30882.1 EAL domain, c-di-GMP-specific phosphodiesterase class I (or its enzymatically inactive variant) [Granulicella rosea]
MASVLSFITRKPAPRAPVTMAFQPIVDVRGDRIVAYEALARGLQREPAQALLGGLSLEQLHLMDGDCRSAAIDWAGRLGLMQTRADLCINFSPNSVLETAEGLSGLAELAAKARIPLDRIVLEITEMERIRDHEQLRALFEPYRTQGLRTAIDDFGAGYAGLSMLAAFQPDILKIDIELTRRIHERWPSQTIVKSILQVCRDLDIDVIAEGIEQEAEFDTLYTLGVRKFQGFYFGRPGFERLPGHNRQASSRQYKLI